MPRERFGKEHDFLPKSNILTYEEIRKFVLACKPLGLSKVRITGGEPLLRRDISKLVRQVSELGLEVALTTNGSFLKREAASLAEAGLDRVTISLDAIDQDLHSRITDSNVTVSDILEGIEEATNCGLGPVKVNCVVQRGVNETQIPKLVRQFRGTGVVVRFIEFMDVGEDQRLDPWAGSPNLGDSEFPFRGVRPGPNDTRFAERRRFQMGSFRRFRGGRLHLIGIPAVLRRLREGPSFIRRQVVHLPVHYRRP